MTLSQIAILLGALALLKGALILRAPTAFRRSVKAFPRSRTAGVVLTVIDIVWVAWLLFETHLGRFESWKPALYLLTPAVIALLIIYMDELLAPRAAGGLLLLAASPILKAAMWNESPLRLVVTVIAYIWIIYAMIIILSPFRFRLFAASFINNPLRMRVGGFAAVTCGIALIVLGLTVY